MKVLQVPKHRVLQWQVEPDKYFAKAEWQAIDGTWVFTCGDPKFNCTCTNEEDLVRHFESMLHELKIAVTVKRTTYGPDLRRAIFH